MASVQYNGCVLQRYGEPYIILTLVCIKYVVKLRKLAPGIRGGKNFKEYLKNIFEIDLCCRWGCKLYSL